jgi:hypothetical protein
MDKELRQLYESVTDALAPVAQHAGDYLHKQYECLINRKLTVTEYVDALLVADDVFSDAIAALRRVRFPTEAHRSNLGRLIDSLQTFRRGIATDIKTAEKGDGKWDASRDFYYEGTMGTSEYWERTGEASE